MTTESDLETLALELLEIREQAREELRDLRSEVKAARSLRFDLERERRELRDYVTAMFDTGLEAIANEKLVELGNHLSRHADQMKREFHDILRELAASLTGTRKDRVSPLAKMIQYVDHGGHTAADITRVNVTKVRDPRPRPPVKVKGKPTRKGRSATR